MYQRDRSARHLLKASVIVLGIAASTGCDIQLNTIKCIPQAGNNDCHDPPAPSNDLPEHDPQRGYIIKRLGSAQCNIATPGDHLGNPLGSGSPVVLYGSVDAVAAAFDVCHS